jgi:hypothetical protein
MDWLRAAVWLAVITGIVIVWVASKRGRGRPGSGTMGTVYDLLN